MIGRGLLATVVSGLLGLVLVVIATGPAQAHNALLSTAPTDGQQLDAVPATIELVFNEPAIALGTQVIVTGPDGDVQEGAPRLVDTTVSQPLAPGAPAGRYEVVWRVTSADGHPISGRFAFTAAAAGTGSPRPTASVPAATPESAPAPSQPSAAAAIPSWAWLVTIAVSLLALGSIAYHVRQRRRS